MLDIKNIVTEVKNAFNGLISRLRHRKKLLSQRIYQQKTLSKTEKQKTKKNRTEYPRILDNYKNCNICIMGVPDGEERKEQKKYLKQQ